VRNSFTSKNCRLSLFAKCLGRPSWSNDAGDKSAKVPAFAADADIELEEPGNPPGRKEG